MDSKPTLVGKISTKTVIGGIKEIKAAADGPIMRIFGIMRGTKKGMTARQNQDGSIAQQEWTAFIGNFQAVNLLTGQNFISAKAFLPGAAGALIEQTWNEAQDGENGAESMKFAFDIIKTANDTSAVGYTYSATPLILASSDPLVDLARELAGQIEHKPEETEAATVSGKGKKK